MASQLARVRRDKRLTPDQLAALNTRLRRLPEVLAEQQRQKVVTEQIRQSRRRTSLAEQQAEQRERESRAGFGLEVAKFGATQSLYPEIGGLKIGDAQNKISGLFGLGTTTEPVTKVDPSGVQQMSGALPSSVKGGLFSNLTLGSTLGAGTTGFGIGQMVGGKGTGSGKRLLFGALGGGLLNLFTGGGSFNLQNFISGGLFGGLGGLAGGLM
jgi:hypothetical protein